MANYTPNYQLHQWEPEDKFLRTDFNQDLSKIDTALGTMQLEMQQQIDALKAASCYEKLLDLTLGTDTQKWDIDMSGIDLTKYQKLVLYPHLKGNTDQWVYLHLNGTSTEYGNIPMINEPDRQNFGAVEITLVPELPRIFIYRIGVTSVYEEAHTKPAMLGYVNFVLNEATTHLNTIGLWFNIGSYRIYSGSNLQIYGLKR